MSLHSLRRAFLAVATLALAACAGEGVISGRPPGPVPVASGPTLLAQRLPAQAAGFQRGATAPVPRGVEVAYATAGRSAAAFVQVLSAPDGAPLADGFGAAAVQAEFERSMAEAARGAGQHRRLRVTTQSNLPSAGPLFRCAELEGTYGRTPVQSLVCVGAAGGQLLRLRASMPRRTPALADPAAFVTAIAAALRAG